VPVTAPPPAQPGPNDVVATGNTATEPEGRARNRDKTKGPRLGRVGRRRRDKTDTDDNVAHERPRAGNPTVTVRADADDSTARAEVPMQDRIRPNLNDGVTPQDQIARRNQASRADASVLAAKRAAAASRALDALGAIGLPDRPARTVSPAARVQPAPPASSATPTPTPTVSPAAAKVSPAAPPTAPTPAPSVAPIGPPASPPAETPRGEVQSPLLEVSGTADVDHTRDQLAIFTDRVELRDRLDRVRTSIKADDIVGVNVQVTASGAVLSVESISGPDIAATGLRAGQAEEARRLILAKTRPARVASLSTGPAPSPTPPTPSASARFDGPELVGKLADLRRAGILTEEEYQQKLVLVRRLAAAEPARQPAS
jgi:hypothetical protein